MQEEQDAAVPWRAHWPALVLVLVAAVVALWAKAVLFPHLSWNRDEPVYLWQMEVLRAGRLAAPDGDFPRLFLPWLSAARGGELFGQYTLGWPVILLVARETTGTATAALPLAGALCAGGTYALAYELQRSRAAAVVAGSLMVLSPIFALQTGVFLAYVFTLGLGLLSGALLLSGLRRGRWSRLVLSGALLGWVFLTRPYDMVIWGGVLGTYALLTERRRLRELIRPLALVGAAILPFVAAGLLYNRRLTGSLLEFPMTMKDPLDTFGFGTRRLAPDFAPVGYGLRSAARSSAKNAFVFPWFLAGSYVAVVVAIGAVIRWWRRPAIWLLVAIGLAFPVAYLPFWGTYLSSLASRISGPIYLVPLYAPACTLVAVALVHWWRTRPRWAVVVGAVLLVSTVPVAWDRFSLNREISQSQATWGESLAVVEDPSIVLVADSSYVLYANPFGANAPGLDGARLYAVPRGPEVLELLADHPDRRAYLQAADLSAPELGPREDPPSFDVTVEPARVIDGGSIAIRTTFGAPLNPGEVEVQVSTGAETLVLPSTAAGAGSEVVVGGTGLDLDSAGELTVTVSWQRGAGDPPPLRGTWFYRQTGGQVEILVPGLWQRWTRIDASAHEWRHVRDPGDISVSIRPIG